MERVIYALLMQPDLISDVHGFSRKFIKISKSIDIFEVSEKNEIQDIYTTLLYSLEVYRPLNKNKKNAISPKRVFTLLNLWFNFFVTSENLPKYEFRHLHLLDHNQIKMIPCTKLSSLQNNFVNLKNQELQKEFLEILFVVATQQDALKEIAIYLDKITSEAA